MKVCGIEIKGSEAIIAVAEIEDGEISHSQLDTKRIALQDDEDTGQVKSFSALVSGFARDNTIECIAIKKRSKKGEFAGGPVTFKIEGIIQLAGDCGVILLPSATISAANRKYKFDIPKSLNKYQHEAFLTACTAIMKSTK
ncbi:DUF3010 family protein [Sulfuriferula sp. GW1]|uniref:DUF3010 family protein n=1 Tax=Sulfuriferula sp. GW1 TaxID=3345111 RepID=UPI0039AF78CF